MNRRYAAFTLIELLVVVAIIAILMAVLLPSLSNARNQAKAVTCQTNIRSLVIADMIYADENQNWTTPVSITMNGTLYHWWDFLKPNWSNRQYRTPAGTTAPAPFCAALFDRNNAHQVTSVGKNDVTGYHFNNMLYGGMAHLGGGRRTGFAANPSRIARVWDDTQVYRTWQPNADGGFPDQITVPTAPPTNGNGAGWYQLDFRHPGNGMNVGMMDGHVEVLKYNTRGPKGEVVVYPVAYCYPQYAWDWYAIYR